MYNPGFYPQELTFEYESDLVEEGGLRNEVDYFEYIVHEYEFYFVAVSSF